MPQQTNLNVSPYYDDFDPNKGYHRVLFKPGFPVQARELSTLQSILQNQVEKFGSHIFKEGSIVVPGSVTFDGQYYAVQVNPTHLGTDIGVYADKVIGKIIKGQTTGTTAKVINFISASQSDNDYDTFYVKYINSASTGDFNFFSDGEILVAEESFTYGGTTINVGGTFASTIDLDACSIGSAASVDEGIYFLRGCFVKVEKQTIILDQYNPQPSFRVGLRVVETNVSAKSDESLYDNAKGFSNFAAPGADRLKINLVLDKKAVSDFNDTDFVEILRVSNGEILSIKRETEYSKIREYLAKRTFDESGDYTVNKFLLNITECLNDRKGNNGVYFSDQTTFDGNQPDDDLACLKISAGKAYVKGYEVSTDGPTTIDFFKPRETGEVKNKSFPFEMGNKFIVNNVSGISTFTNRINLMGGPNSGGSANVAGTASKIGDAKVYNLGLRDRVYKDASTEFDMYLYDIQTYTTLQLNDYVSNSELNESAFIVGKESGANAFAVTAGAGSSTIQVTQTSGTFRRGEEILINGTDATPRTIEGVTPYGINDVFSFAQSGNSFTANKKLTDRIPPRLGNGNVKITKAGATATVTAPRIDSFQRFKPGDVIRFVEGGNQYQNVVLTIAADLQSMTVGAMTTVANLFEGTVKTFEGPITIGSQDGSDQNASLITVIPDLNVSNVDFTGSTLLLSTQIQNESTNALGQLVIPISSVDIPDTSFAGFDEERYQVQYSNGNIGVIEDDQVTVTGTQVTITGLLPSQTGMTVNVTVIKAVVKNKVKEFKRCQQVAVTRSKNKRSGTDPATSINDGLNHSALYGLRVQDRDISLNEPDAVDIVAIYESLDSSAPIPDKLSFSSTDDVFTSAIIGENIFGSTSKAIAKVVSVDAGNSQIDIVYLTNDRFTVLEPLKFEESNTTAVLQGFTPGKYRDITSSYMLDKGQRNQYYDYSRIVRNRGAYIPHRQLLIIYNRYDVPTGDTGDVFTVNSYNEERYTKDIPQIGNFRIEAHDCLDFRPRVSSYNPASGSVSPFFYTARDFDGKPDRILTPNESMTFDYDFYLPRIDKVVLLPDGNFDLLKGKPARQPVPPVVSGPGMEIGTILLPAYLRDTDEARVYLKDNRRYTMRDIGDLADRIENLEVVTSLNLLEKSAESLQIRDSQGLTRFKSGFFVDNFKTFDFMHPSSPCEIDRDLGELRPLREFESSALQVAAKDDLPVSQIDYSSNFLLLDELNTQKTGNLLSLKYEEVQYIKQEFATRVNNINPFHVVAFTGELRLNPSIDNWINTRETQNVIRNTIGITVFNNQVAANFSLTRGGALGGSASVTTRETGRTVQRDDIRSENTFIAEETFDPFCRSRNIEFNAIGLKPFTNFFPFFDNQGGVDIIPKLLEVANVSGSFQTGETIRGSIIGTGGGTSFEFRLAAPNHKNGPFNAPTTTYTVNPYDPTSTLPNGYSQASTVLNIDITSLSAQAQGAFFGFAPTGMLIRGLTSGAQAVVAGVRLVSDDFGDLFGSIFLRDPNQTPTPQVRIRSGNRDFRLTSSQSNENPAPGSTLISHATGRYTATGTTRVVQTDIRITTLETTTITNLSTIDIRGTVPEPPPPPPPVIINNTRVIDRTRTVIRNRTRVIDRTRTIRVRERDPLAQTIVTGPEGAWITSLDLFFATKNAGTTPVRIEVRTVELGTPTLFIIDRAAQATIRPSDIQTSKDGSVATNIKFDTPFYLDPDESYAIVILSDSDEYEVFCGEMGQKALNAQSLPSAKGKIYSQQFAMGSLFKSQNGATWTPTQFEDLTFTLYRAKYTSSQGLLTFFNPPVEPNNGLLPPLPFDPITALPKKGKLGIVTTTNAGLIGTVFAPGRKISEQTSTYRYGHIENKGGPATGVVGILTSGSNYGTPTNPVSTYNITGDGSGLTLNATVGSGISAITAVTIVGAGRGYKVGDVVGIVTADIGGSGSGVRIGINSINGIDTLYLTDVQAETFDTTSGNEATYYHEAGSIVDTGLDIISFDNTGSVYTGEYFRVSHRNHGMHSVLNKVILSDIQSDVLPTELSVDVASNETSISIASTEQFNTFEGALVSAANTGYALINSEILSYTSVGVSSLGGVVRGVDSTNALNHLKDEIVQKYEYAGVSLLKVNTEHDVQSILRGIDNYYLRIDRGSSRSVDDNANNIPQVSFKEEAAGGGQDVHASKNIQFDAVRPLLDASTFGPTDFISLQMRSVTGTSVDGSETSFVDNGFEDLNLNRINILETTRLLAARTNESARLGSLPRNKSFTFTVELANSGDEFNSPTVNLEGANALFYENRLNNPIEDYRIDPRVKSRFNDPHASYYMSQPIYIKNPATSLKVVFEARRPIECDFRVLYSILKTDSSEVTPDFELFPGHFNLIDTDGDGLGDQVIDVTENDGRPDAFVAANEMTYREYTYSVDDLPSFNGFQIKIVFTGTNQAKHPVLKNLRAIAVA
tara:strand:+ start:5231 stop:12553 length:7323 start_codon:yes stop_codon:yes gene_type:complete